MKLKSQVRAGTTSFKPEPKSTEWITRIKL